LAQAHWSEARRREPVFNAPWPALVIAVAIVALYALQSRAGDEQGLFLLYGLRATELQDGRWLGLLTSLFLHGGWAHAALNAVGALAFGAPVARLLGLSPARALAFLLFYLLCGAAAGYAYVQLNPDSPAVLVGASGAVSGLMGAASRMLGQGGRLGPLISRNTLGFSAAWILANALIGLLGFAPGSGGAPVAWEAHIAGFFAGLILIGPWALVLGRRAERGQELPAPHA
jgi:membrane associated rhomboid family serine protease